MRAFATQRQTQLLILSPVDATARRTSKADSATLACLVSGISVKKTPKAAKVFSRAKKEFSD
jgi:hypothetical protein